MNHGSPTSLSRTLGERVTGCGLPTGGEAFPTDQNPGDGCETHQYPSELTLVTSKMVPLIAGPRKKKAKMHAKK